LVCQVQFSRLTNNFKPALNFGFRTQDPKILFRVLHSKIQTLKKAEIWILEALSAFPNEAGQDCCLKWEREGSKAVAPLEPIERGCNHNSRAQY
jgi:hypothetical protein